LPEVHAVLKAADLVIITADHGNDPSFPGTDHTREHVPILAFGPGVAGRAIGKRATFADIGQSVAAHLGLAPLPVGTSWL
jgi:phosphopentomutase